MHRWGHLRVRALLQRETFPAAFARRSLVMQFTSVARGPLSHVPTRTPPPSSPRRLHRPASVISSLSCLSSLQHTHTHTQGSLYGGKGLDPQKRRAFAEAVIDSFSAGRVEQPPAKGGGAGSGGGVGGAGAAAALFERKRAAVVWPTRREVEGALMASTVCAPLVPPLIHPSPSFPCQQRAISRSHFVL